MMVNGVEPLVLSLAVCAASCGTAETFGAYVFTEDFESTNWMNQWVIRGQLEQGINASNVVQFSDRDARLGGATHGSRAGGIAHAGYQWGGDNVLVMMDYVMHVPAGNYTFTVEVDGIVNYEEAAQPWGLGMSLYLGDSPDMEFVWVHGGPFGGPWRGAEWAGWGNGTELHRHWNGGQDGAGWVNDLHNGQWQHWAISETYETNDNDPNSGFRHILHTDGTLIFRFGGQFKEQTVAGTVRQSLALDDLTITLTPVPEPSTAIAILPGVLMWVLRRRSSPQKVPPPLSWRSNPTEGRGR